MEEAGEERLRRGKAGCVSTAVAVVGAVDVAAVVVFPSSLFNLSLSNIQLTPVMNLIMSSTGSLENILSSILKECFDVHRPRREKKVFEVD